MNNKKPTRKRKLSSSEADHGMGVLLITAILTMLKLLVEIQSLT